MTDLFHNLTPNRSWGLRYFAADGSVVDLTDTSRYIAVDRKGFGLPKHTVLANKGVQADGAFPSRITLDQHEFTVGVYLIDRVEPLNALRQKLVSAFDPVNGTGQLEYRDNAIGKTWTANVLPEALPLDTAAGQAKALLVQMSWVAYDPYWYGPIRSLDIAPDGGATYVTNGGGVPVGWTLSAPGPLNNPSFVNVTTGQGIAFALYVPPNQSLLITNKPGAKGAALVEHDYPFATAPAYPNRALHSLYWQLGRGESELRLSSTPLQPLHHAAQLSFQEAVKGV